MDSVENIATVRIVSSSRSSNDDNEGTMDTAWFRQQLVARKITQRTLAKQMNLDHAAVSLMLRGKRRMQPKEAQQLADVLGVKTTEILRRAGTAVRDDVQRVPITSYINGNSEVTLFPQKTHDSVEGPADCPKGTFAIQCRCPSKPQDGWLMFIAPGQNVPEKHLDKLCLVTMSNGTSTVAVLRRGYRANTYNLMRGNSSDVMTDINVTWVAPVLWIKP
jgi:transcriptional regulator with XRE-family HTH domain